jgi:methylthioribulose-1-phosphate dehydratase
MSLPASATHRLLTEAPALCQAINAIHQRGWCDGTGGNFSSVLCHDPLALLMAPSGVDKGSLQPADLIVVDADGQVLCGEGKASAETLLHLAIITTTKAGSVLHTHSQAATLLSQRPPADNHPSRPSHQLLPAQPHPVAVHSQERPSGAQTPTPPALLGHLRLVDLEMAKGLEGIHSHTTLIAIPILANSQNIRQLSLAATPHLADAPHGLLIAGHGLYAWGDSLRQARRHLEILEFLLEQHWRQTLLNALLRTEHNPQ